MDNYKKGNLILVRKSTTWGGSDVVKRTFIAYKGKKSAIVAFNSGHTETVRLTSIIKAV